MIPFELKQYTAVDLEIFDLGSRRVRLLRNVTPLDARPHEAVWSGVIQISRKMTLVR